MDSRAGAIRLLPFLFEGGETVLTASNIIEKVRWNVNDQQETGFSDEMLLGFINDGIRLLRRTIMDTNPDLLQDYDYIGTLPAGVSRIALTDASPVTVRLSRVIEVRVGGKAVPREDRRRISDLSRVGRPICYYIVGNSTLGFYPVPDEDVDIEVVGIKDQELLTSMDDKSPFLNELDDFLVEYVGIRAKFTDEFDQSQESQLFAQITQQIEAYALNMLPAGVTVNGVWDQPRIRRDYGRTEIL